MYDILLVSIKWHQGTLQLPYMKYLPEWRLLTKSIAGFGGRSSGRKIEKIATWSLLGCRAALLLLIRKMGGLFYKTLKCLIPRTNVDNTQLTPCFNYVFLRNHHPLISTTSFSVVLVSECVISASPDNMFLALDYSEYHKNRI